MTDWTTARVTPEKLAELRRLLERAIEIKQGGSNR